MGLGLGLTLTLDSSPTPNPHGEWVARRPEMRQAGDDRLERHADIRVPRDLIVGHHVQAQPAHHTEAAQVDTCSLEQLGALVARVAHLVRVRVRVRVRVSVRARVRVRVSSARRMLKLP